MNKVLFVFLSLSVSGSILALILLTLKPLIKNRLSQTWQYYIWLIVILRFLLPFTPQVSVVGEMSRQIGNIANPPAAVEIGPGVVMDEEYTTPQSPDLQALQNTEAETPVHPAYWRDILSNVWLLWIGVALVLFVHKVASYRSFVRFVKVGIEKITDTNILDIYGDELAAAKVKRRLPIYVNNQVASPMLVGIIHPALIIPILETGDGELRNILRHELTHYKRLDFLYKWVVQITLCLHWFNPLVRLISQHINKSCELSCDEAVIKHLDEDGRITYGDALIASLTARGNYSDFVVSMTMSENGNIVKERLDMIMSYQGKSKIAVVCSWVLSAAILCCSMGIGAYAAPAKIVPIEDANIDSLSDAEKTMGRLVPTSDLRSTYSGPESIGTQESLDAWNIALIRSDYTVAKLTISSNSVEAISSLTEAQYNGVMKFLLGMNITTYEQLGNSPIGDAIHVLAYDSYENLLWHVELNGEWLIVDMGGTVSVFNAENNPLDNLKSYIS